jgi:nucleoprotein TPR
VQKRASEIDSRVEAATTSLRGEKEAANSLANTRQSQIEKLTSDLEAARKDVETKHSIGMRWKGRGDALIAEAKTRTETLAARDQTITELNEKVDNLTKELEDTKAKITELEKKVADTERGNHAKDMTVQRLQSELSKAQGGAAKLAPAQAAPSTDNSEELVSKLITAGPRNVGMVADYLVHPTKRTRLLAATAVSGQERSGCGSG